MKKIYLALATFAFATLSLNAQTEFDGIKLLNNDILGTARYSAMAGAFSALGGDASAIKDNPAGLGIFRKSEFTTTLNPFINNTTSSWNGMYDYDDTYNVNFNQMALVLASSTKRAKNGGTEGLLMSNWAFNFNRLKDFSRSTRISSNSTTSSFTDYAAAFTGSHSGYYVYDDVDYEPFDNTDIPWISVMSAYGELIFEDTLNSSWISVLNEGEKVQPTYALNESGHLDSYSLSWAGNYNNRFFLGASLNVMKYLYKADMNYGESFESNGSFNFKNTLRTSGTGIGFKLGAIYAPLDYLRIGASLEAPTVYKMSDTNQSELNSDVFNVLGITSPYGYSDYKFQSPVKTNLSAALIIGKIALVDVEYEHTFANNSRILNLDNSTLYLDEVNDAFRNNIKPIRTLKAGVEFKANDKVAIRAGYANTDSYMNADAAKVLMDNTVRTDADYYLHKGTYYITGGIGYRESDWFVDVAVSNKEIEEDFYPYDSSMLPTAYQVKNGKVITNQGNLLVTVGFKL